MKEIKVRLEKNKYKQLSRSAQKNLRSINKQVTIYILRGLDNEEQGQAS